MPKNVLLRQLSVQTATAFSAAGRCLPPVCRSSLEALDVAVALERRHHDVEEPEEEEQRRRDVLDADGAAELAADGRRAADQHRDDGDERARAEDGHREAQSARLDDEPVALGRVVYGRDRPRDADAEEHVDRVAAGDVADRRVGVLVVDRRHLARERVCAIDTLQKPQ